MYLGEAFSLENLEEGYSIDSSCDTNVSRYFMSDRCLSSASKPDSNCLKPFAPPQTGKVDHQQEKNKRKQCVFPVKAVQTIRPEIHLHKPVKA